MVLGFGFKASKTLVTNHRNRIMIRDLSTGRPISWRSLVGLTLILDVPPTCPAAHPVLLISHQPRQNQAEGGTAKIKVNPTEVRQEMCHPVVRCPIKRCMGYIFHFQCRKVTTESSTGSTSSNRIRTILTVQVREVPFAYKFGNTCQLTFSVSQC